MLPKLHFLDHQIKHEKLRIIKKSVLSHGCKSQRNRLVMRNSSYLHNFRIVMIDKHIPVGVLGTISSISLGQWNHIAGIGAAVVTIIYMCIRIYQALTKKK